MLPIFSGRFGGGLSFFNHPLSKNTTGSLSNIFQSAERDVSRSSKNDNLLKQGNISQSQLSLARRESRDSMFALSINYNNYCYPQPQLKANQLLRYISLNKVSDVLLDGMIWAWPCLLGKE